MHCIIIIFNGYQNDGSNIDRRETTPFIPAGTGQVAIIDSSQRNAWNVVILTSHIIATGDQETTPFSLNDFRKIQYAMNTSR